MAKITHSNYVETVNDIVNESRNRKVTHLTCHGPDRNGSDLQMEDRTMLNFGSCGYLGLEKDDRLIEGAIDFTKRYGTQFGISRAFVTTDENRELEFNIGQMYGGKKALIYSSTSLAHNSVLPIVVSPEDAIILDQQVHFSVQNAAQLMSAKGVPIEMIRHSNLDMLERSLIKLRDKHSKIWYMIDGVYSMYGDIAPIQELNELMKKYPALHLYADDAHGIGWSGQNGSGSIYEDILFTERVMFMATMGKSFGVIGGIAVFPTIELYKKVQTFGGALSYSHPLPPQVIGAALAASRLMLSPEIDSIQSDLQEKIGYCNTLLDGSGLPIMSDERTPIFFIGTGKPSMGYELNKRMLDDGFYVSLAVYPAVSMKNTGLRFSINRHLTKKHIFEFVEALKYHYPRALKKEDKTWNDVLKAFKLPLLDINTGHLEEIIEEKPTKNVFVQSHTSISEIKKEDWDAHMLAEGRYSHSTMQLLERSFSGNTWDEHNWKFYYLIVRDEDGVVVASTYLTSCLIKDDLFSYSEISEKVEQSRKTEPYYLTSKALVMGSMASEGEHLYINHDHVSKDEAVELLLNEISRIQDQDGSNSVILRDFTEFDTIEPIMHDFGFAKMRMPNGNTISKLNRSPENDFVSTLSKRSRRHVRNECIKNEHLFNFDVSNTISEEELNLFYKMYCDVSEKNLAVNTFEYPIKFFKEMNESREWEWVKLGLKSENLNCAEETIVAIGCCYKQEKNYTPFLVGMDYNRVYELNAYKQFLYRICLSARQRDFEKVFFGYTADVEKKKLGAEQQVRYAFTQIHDGYNQEIISQISR